jgi:ADP-heptose:LPS heptosyltransferase
VDLFNQVHVLRRAGSAWKQLFRAFMIRRRLRDYEVVLDLQGNRVSRFIRRRVKAEAFSEVDHDLPRASGFSNALEAAGMGLLARIRPLVLKNEEEGLHKLTERGWNGSGYVVLNPAGAFETMNWPLDSYVEFANLWIDRDPEEMKFVVLGLEEIAEKAQYLKERLGDHLIDLTGQTSMLEAFGIVHRAKLVLSEDSALMHMAFSAGVPVVALFGSSRGDLVSPPPGSRFVFLHSGDMDCGFCTKTKCDLGDVRCLSRHTPDEVLREAFGLLLNA